MMRTIKSKIVLAGCCVGVLALGYSGLAQAQSPTILAGTSRQEQEAGGPSGTLPEEGSIADTIRIWGTVLGVEDGMLRIDNQSGTSFAGEIILNIDPDYSRVVDGENGYPVDLSSIQAGQFIYAYIGPAMTMSLPPMTTAEMVICQIPEDFRAPDYVQVESMEKADDGWNLTAKDGTSYYVPSECPILPYLTRNMVRLEDVTKDSSCLVWMGDEGNVQKIVLFPEDM
ncbi:MAG: hypothetical protein HFG54_01135 [Lachnospiraceae bacterium]|jgi:hypothetical protein|nr:hypothetical protein [Lachnospiraceae bacterium]